MLGPSFTLLYLQTMSKTLSFWAFLFLLLQALLAPVHARQRILMAEQPQIMPSNVTAAPAMELPAVEAPSLELATDVAAAKPSAAQQVEAGLATASDTVSNVGGAVVNGTTDVAFALVGTVSSLARTVSDLSTVIGAAVGRKLLVDD